MKRKREILLYGNIVTSEKEPEYVFFYEDELVYYKRHTEVHFAVPKRTKRVVVSRYDDDEVGSIIYFQKNFSTCEIYRKLIPVKWSEFVKRLGDINFIWLDSLNDWIWYLDNFILNCDPLPMRNIFLRKKINAVKEILKKTRR